MSLVGLSTTPIPLVHEEEKNLVAQISLPDQPCFRNDNDDEFPFLPSNFSGDLADLGPLFECSGCHRGFHKHHLAILLSKQLTDHELENYEVYCSSDCAKPITFPILIHGLECQVKDVSPAFPIQSLLDAICNHYCGREVCLAANDEESLQTVKNLRDRVHQVIAKDFASDPQEQSDLQDVHEIEDHEMGANWSTHGLLFSHYRAPMTERVWHEPGNYKTLVELTQKQHRDYLHVLVRFCHSYVNTNEMKVTIATQTPQKCCLSGFYFSDGQFYILPTAGDFVETNTDAEKEDLILHLLNYACNKAGWKWVAKNSILGPIYKAKEISNDRKKGLVVSGAGLVEYLRLPSRVVFGEGDVAPEIRVETVAQVVDEPVVEHKVANERVAQVVDEVAKEPINEVVDEVANGLVEESSVFFDESEPEDHDSFVDPPVSRGKPSYAIMAEEAIAPVVHSSIWLVDLVDDALREKMRRNGFTQKNYHVYCVQDDFYQTFDLRVTDNLKSATIDRNRYLAFPKKDICNTTLANYSVHRFDEWRVPFFNFVWNYYSVTNSTLPIIKMSDMKDCCLIDGRLTFTPNCEFVENDNETSRLDLIVQIFDVIYSKAPVSVQKDESLQFLYTKLKCKENVDEILEHYILATKMSVLSTEDLQGDIFGPLMSYAKLEKDDNGEVTSEIDFPKVPRHCILSTLFSLEDRKSVV